MDIGFLFLISQFVYHGFKVYVDTRAAIDRPQGVALRVLDRQTGIREVSLIAATIVGMAASNTFRNQGNRIIVDNSRGAIDRVLRNMFEQSVSDFSIRDVGLVAYYFYRGNNVVFHAVNITIGVSIYFIFIEIVKRRARASLFYETERRLQMVKDEMVKQAIINSANRRIRESERKSLPQSPYDIAKEEQDRIMTSRQLKAIDDTVNEALDVEYKRLSDSFDKKN